MQSQDAADQYYKRFRSSDPAWAWKFRILEAESALWRGLNEETVRLLEFSPTPSIEKSALIQVLALKGTAYAHLGDLKAADSSLAQGDGLCLGPPDPACGNLTRARGVLSLARGDFPAAERYFAQSLSFARSHNDRFLEATALLNIGATMLKEERFDEAINWSQSAFETSTAIEARNVALVALENTGWAYYNLGDSERALDLFLHARQTAVECADVIDQVSLLTDAGYVYAGKRDDSRAKAVYLEALRLAKPTKSAEHTYNVLRALALVSVQRGEMEEATAYAGESLALARSSESRLNELYPLLVKGLVAAHSNDGADAERIFREIEFDSEVKPSLKWKAEHALARLYEDQGRANAADGVYRAALATFEAARPSRKREDTALPFLANAARIYDDYLHFLISRKRSDEALRWADHSRARGLAEGLGVLPEHTSVGPPPLAAQQIARKVGGTLLFYWLGEKQSYLWAITAKKTTLFTLPPGAKIEAAVQSYRHAIDDGPDVRETADENGRLLYQMLITPAQSLISKDAKVFILPDGQLNDLNFETLLVQAPSLHYWIDDVTLASASSLRMLDAWAEQAKATTKQPRSLLLIGRPVPPNDRYPELPKGQSQMDAVKAHFVGVEHKILTGAEATPPAYLDGHPENNSYIHFVTHGIASRLSPLDSAIVLSKSSADGDSFKLYARDIIQRPLRAELVTVAACYGAKGPTYSGEGLVGLSWAFLRAGAHNVVAALWEVTDAPAPQQMDEFYRRIERGEGVNAALRSSKLALLHGDKYRNPYYWATFQLYVGARTRTPSTMN